MNASRTCSTTDEPLTRVRETDRVDRFHATAPGSPGSIDRRVHYTWGPRYIDDIAFRRVDNDGDEDYSDTGDEIYYHLTDAQFSTKTVIDSTATIVEWVEYTPYGVARHHHKYDVDGDLDSADTSQIQTWIDKSTYDVLGDLDLDGDVDAIDKLIASNSPATTGGLDELSHAEHANRKGYAGYEFDDTITHESYHVRHRVLNSVLGPWGRRNFSRFEYASDSYLYSNSQGNQNDPCGCYQLPEGPVREACVIGCAFPDCSTPCSDCSVVYPPGSPEYAACVVACTGAQPSPGFNPQPPPPPPGGPSAFSPQCLSCRAVTCPHFMYQPL